jgi:hypothetical protein
MTETRYADMEQRLEAHRHGTEDNALRSLYLAVPAKNFSDEVLSARPSHLAVISAHRLGRSDLGEPERVGSIRKCHAAGVTAMAGAAGRY